MPWFVNWDNYKTTFEIEAEKILGQPVRVEGSAEASILPSPSLSFTNVEVGGVAGEPMMTVERFSVTIEMMPLLQGEIRVVSMKLERPRMRVTIDERGSADWFKRTEASEALDPEKVVLEGVEISGGSLVYADTGSGVTLGFEEINASIEARTLLGPWRIEGSYLDNGERVPFHFATGIRLDDGTIRVKSNFSPARFSFDVAADGVISNAAETGPTYRGTYNVAEVGTTAEAATGDFAGWRSEGSFTLTPARLAVDKAVVSQGPPDRPTSIAATVTVTFGDKPTFVATAEARQIDLDRTLGGGPSEPIDVSLAGEHLVAFLSSLQIPDISGRITVDVPAIVVGGSVIQDVRFAAEPALAGWRIDNFRARLPGQARLDADGVLTTDKTFGFLGTARLSVAQPATFAAWWRGTEQEAGRLLAAFDLAGETEIAPGRVAVDAVEARIGDATITGRFSWSESPRDRHRHLGTDLKADRIDFVQVKALAELLVGRNLTDTAGLADSYSVIVQADAFEVDDIRMADVAINAAYSDDSLTVVQFAVGDIGGASFRVTSGRIDNVTNALRGHLVAELNAPRLDELARIVDRFAPNTGIARWLTAASPALAPAAFTARIAAPAEEGGTGFRIALEGAAGATVFDIVADSSGNLTDWQSAPAKLSVSLDSPDTAGLARQFGLAAVALDDDAGTHVVVGGSGMPGEGLDATINADIAGLTASGAGKLAVAADFTAAFTGSFDVTADNLDPLIAMAGLGIPGAAIGTDVDVDGTVAVSAAGADLEWGSATIGGHVVGGKVRLARAFDRTWRIDGNLDIDEADLGWMMALGLGFPPIPTGDPAAPWSKTPFISPVYGPVAGKLAVSADHLIVGDGLDLANARFDVALQPQRIDVDLAAAQLAGGALTGGLSIHNVAGNANLIARFNLTGAALEDFVWQLDGRSVATGEFDLSANFEATGRSPTGLVSSATGGGAFSIRDGEARYVNANAARLVVRASDLGQQYSEEALRLSFTENIDADSLRFGRADGAFAIAAGAVRLKNLTLRTEGLEANGNALIDFNTLALDSDWTLTFDPGDTKVEGTDPRVGVVFRGALAAPRRSIDVLPLSSYLNMRQEVRMLEIIAMEEATRAEKDRLTRLTRKLREDDARRARKAREAAEAEARRRAAARAAAVALERLHVSREIVTEQRRVAALKRVAENAAAAGTAARQAADEAARIAAAEHERAEAARAALARAIAAEREATTKALATADALAEAGVDAEAAERTATEAAAAAAAADEAAAGAIAAEAEAIDLAGKAAADKENADAALAASVANAGSAGVAVDQADAGAAEAARALAAAEAVALEADAALAGAEETLTDAQARFDAAEADANDKNEAEAVAADAANAAATHKWEADNVAARAADDVAVAGEDLDAALAQVEATQVKADVANAAAAEAESIAEKAASLAETLLADKDADEEAIASARDMETIARQQSRRAAERRETADEAERAAAAARAHRDLAQARLSEAEKKSAAATAAAAAAEDAAADAVSAAEEAAAANKAALELLATATDAQAAAKTEVSVRKAAAEAAGVVLAEAERASSVALAEAASARAAAGSVLDEKTAAESVAAGAASAAAAADQAVAEAAGARAVALAAQEAARDEADVAGAAVAPAAEALAERSRADESAQAALVQARAALEATKRDVAAAVVAAREATDAAEAANAEAEAKAAAADAAKQAADRAAQEAAPFDTGAGPVAPDRRNAAVPTPRSGDLSPALAARDRPLNIGAG